MLLLVLSQSATMIFYAFNSFGLPLEEAHLPFVQTSLSSTPTC